MTDGGTRVRAIRRVLLITLCLNMCVAAAKLIAGYMLDIISLQADGYHTTFDALSNVIGLVALGVARLPPDAEHPYGHGKFEVAASLVIGLMVLLGLVEVARGVWESATAGTKAIVDARAYGVVIATIFVNIGISVYERREGRRLGSLILMSDAAHTLSDSLAALAVLIGIYFVDIGFPIGDTIASIVVMTFIGATAYRVLRDGLDVIVDAAHLDASAVRQVVEADERVVSCHYVRSRGMPGHIHLEFHLSLDPDVSMREAGEIMLNVKSRVREEFPEVRDIVVQLEPHEAHHVEDVPEALI